MLDTANTLNTIIAVTKDMDQRLAIEANAVK